MQTSSNFFKLLSDETRLLILMLLHERGELCVCDLTTALLLSQPKISRHLAMLRNQQLVTARRENQWVHYQLNPALPDWMGRIIDLTTQHHRDYLHSRLSATAVESTQTC